MHCGHFWTLECWFKVKDNLGKLNFNHIFVRNDVFSLILQVRFLADCVNCHVIVAGSLLSMFDNFIEVTLEDNIPQVNEQAIPI